MFGNNFSKEEKVVGLIEGFQRRLSVVLKTRLMKLEEKWSKELVVVLAQEKLFWF